MDQLSPLAQAIYCRKPIQHLLLLIQAGADVNENVTCHPYQNYQVPLLVFTTYRYGIYPTRLSILPPSYRQRYLQYLLNVLYLLLDHGANPSCFLPVHDYLIPFLNKDSALLPYMIERGLTITVQGDTGKTILYRSVERLESWIEESDKMEERLAVIHQLLDLGVDPDLQDRCGETVLHSLLRLPITPPVFKLLQRLLPMVDVSREDNDGNTPLHHYLSRYEQLRTQPLTIPRQQVIDLLVSAGAVHDK